MFFSYVFTQKAGYVIVLLGTVVLTFKCNSMCRIYFEILRCIPRPSNAGPPKTSGTNGLTRSFIRTMSLIVLFF